MSELLARDYVIHAPGMDFHGPEGHRQVYDIYVTAFLDCQFTIEQQAADESIASTAWTFRGTQTGELMGIPASGKKVEVMGVGQRRIVNGRIVEDRVVWDTLGLMRQIGAFPTSDQ